jgi:nicotinamide-nucleotide amidase
MIETLAIGDELLTGKISDTNSSFVGSTLFSKGYRLIRQNVILDDSVAIISAIKEISQRAKVAICFGGLGPTSDDITAITVAQLLQKTLITDEPSKTRMIAFLEARGRKVTEPTLKQVLVPEGTQVIPNFVGLAPGFSFSLNGCLFFFLPGVPSEMKPMFEETVLPLIQTVMPVAGEVESRVWRCIGIVESEVQRLMTPIEKKLPQGVWLGYRTRFPENYLYLYCLDNDPSSRAKKLDAWTKEIESLISPFCYGKAERDLEEWVFDLLKQKNKKTVLAESCTGGLVIHRLTHVPGASDFVWGGYVTYQIEAKEKILGVVLEDPLDAVSLKCTEALAEKSLQMSDCDLSLAITGYMGPSGGTSKDPVGTVYICVLDKQGKKLSEKIQLPPRPRATLQWGASSFALNVLRKFLE